MGVNTPLSYNVLLRRPIINALGAVVSSVHMKLKYPTDKGGLGVIRVVQIVTLKCYEGSLKPK